MVQPPTSNTDDSVNRIANASATHPFEDSFGTKPLTAALRLIRPGNVIHQHMDDLIQKPSKLLLIVEDDQRLALAMERFFRGCGYQVIMVGNGIQAVESAETALPDLILCDLDLPGMGGYEVLSALQENPRLWDVPFLILTGRGQFADIRKGMNSGADDYLVKPVPLLELLAAVRARLNLRQRRVELESTLSGETAAEVTRGDKSDFRPSTGDSASGSPSNTDFNAVFLKTAEGHQRVDFADIQYISAYGEYSRVHYPVRQNALIRKPLKDWEAELPSEWFIRVHRSSILNLRHLERLEKIDDRETVAILRNLVEPVPVSLRKIPVLNRRLKSI